MSQPVAEVVSSPITYDLLLSIIGCLILLIVGLLAWVGKNQIGAIWMRINKHESDIESHEKDKEAHGIAQISVQLKNLDDDIKELKEESKDAARDRKERDKELFGAINEVRQLIYDNLTQGNKQL